MGNALHAPHGNVGRCFRCCENWPCEVTRLREIVKKAARELYALEVRRQSMGWEDGMTERLVALQHQLAVEYNEETPTTSQVASHGGDSPQRGIGGQGRAGTSPAAHIDGEACGNGR